MNSRSLLLGLLSVLILACSTPSGAGIGVSDRADHFLELARAVEPAVTPLLANIAQRNGGDLAGLEHRFKTRSSLTRKIETALQGDPGLRPEDVEIDDALRYTVRIDDAPPGHHVRVVREILTALEERGHVVVFVKNYWPGGDTYSGVNSILRAPGGLLWELQFHTPASFAVKSRTHSMYEIYRLPETGEAERRELFAEMASLWFSVPIPAGILSPRALHARDEVILRQP